jgi:hypothetical protein
LRVVVVLCSVMLWVVLLSRPSDRPS